MAEYAVSQADQQSQDVELDTEVDFDESSFDPVKSSVLEDFGGMISKGISGKSIEQGDAELQALRDESKSEEEFLIKYIGYIGKNTLTSTLRVAPLLYGGSLKLAAKAPAIARGIVKAADVGLMAGAAKYLENSLEADKQDYAVSQAVRTGLETGVGYGLGSAAIKGIGVGAEKAGIFIKSAAEPMRKSQRYATLIQNTSDLIKSIEESGRNVASSIISKADKAWDLAQKGLKKTTSSLEDVMVDIDKMSNAIAVGSITGAKKVRASLSSMYNDVLDQADDIDISDIKDEIQSAVASRFSPQELKDAIENKDVSDMEAKWIEQIAGWGEAAKKQAIQQAKGVSGEEAQAVVPARAVHWLKQYFSQKSREMAGDGVKFEERARLNAIVNDLDERITNVAGDAYKYLGQKWYAVNTLQDSIKASFGRLVPKGLEEPSLTKSLNTQLFEDARKLIKKPDDITSMESFMMNKKKEVSDVLATIKMLKDVGRDDSAGALLMSMKSGLGSAFDKNSLELAAKEFEKKISKYNSMRSRIPEERIPNVIKSKINETKRALYDIGQQVKKDKLEQNVSSLIGAEVTRYHLSQVMPETFKPLFNTLSRPIIAAIAVKKYGGQAAVVADDVIESLGKKLQEKAAPIKKASGLVKNFLLTLPRIIED